MFPHHLVNTAIPVPSDQDVYEFIIRQNTFDLSLLAAIGTLSDPTTIIIRVERGVIVTARSSRSFAMDLSGVLPDGSTIRLYNSGYIDGHGGRGGQGGAAAALFDSPDAFYAAGAQPGEDGGTAIKGPGPGVSLYLYNGAGFVRGGGGGGGGGGASANLTSGSVAAGGGGGGGAGGGDPGDGGVAGHRSASGVGLAGAAGQSGSTGTQGTYGSGGAGVQTGSADGGDAGRGGDWGEAGVVGGSPSGFSRDVAGKAGGAAGDAIDVNGSSLIIVAGGGPPNIRGNIINGNLVLTPQTGSMLLTGSTPTVS